jgi:uncharacterized protein
MQTSSHAPGTPSWADVTGPDVQATAAFYSALFGWDAEDQGEEAGHYTMFSMDGRTVAAASPLQSPEMPPVWTTYVTVADVDATAAAIADAGGAVFVEPFDVMDAGRMAVTADPAGGVFAIWQPGRSIGAEVVNETGAMCWNEYVSRHPGPVLDFYSAVFGWTPTGGEERDGAPPYFEMHLGGAPVAGMIALGDMLPDGVPNHWMVYFAVDDCDATVERATGLGASLVVPPTDLPVGRFANLADPAGAMFAVIALAEPM